MNLKVNWVEALTLGSYPRVEGLGKVRFSPWLRSQTYYYVQDRGLISACLPPSFPSFSVSLHLFPRFLPIFIFCLSPSLPSFSGCLHHYPHFLSVSFSILSICFCLPHFLAVFNFIIIFCLSPSLSVKIETVRK